MQTYAAFNVALMLLLLPAGCLAQTSYDWETVKVLLPESDLRVQTTAGTHPLRCVLERATDDALLCFGNSTDFSVPRTQIRRIRLQTHGHQGSGLGNVMDTAGTGAVLGSVTGALIDVRVGGDFIKGAVLGAAAGCFGGVVVHIAVHHRYSQRTVYRAP